MRRHWLALIALSLLLAGCTAKGPVRSRTKPAPEPKPVAVLIEVQHPRPSADKRYIDNRQVVFRVGLDGRITTLPITPREHTPIVPDGEGRRILYAGLKPDNRRELRLYDIESGVDTLALPGEPLAYGWDGASPVALTGRVGGMPPGMPFFGGSGLGIEKPSIAARLSGEATLAPIAPLRPIREISADLTYLGGDTSAWYFATEAGSLIRVTRDGLGPSVIATWTPSRIGGGFGVEPPRVESRPMLWNATVADTATRYGLPMTVTLFDPLESRSWIEVRRIPSMQVLRKFASLPNEMLSSILSPDLTRLLAVTGPRVVPDAGRAWAIREVVANGKTSVVATSTMNLPFPRALAYIDSAYDLVYGSINASGDAEFRIISRSDGSNRLFARLPRRQLLGYDPPRQAFPDPGRIVGVVR